MSLHVHQVETGEHWGVAVQVRNKVFVEEQGYPGDLEFDEYDTKSTTRHFIGKDVAEDKYVAVARVMIDSEKKSAKLGRIAVLSECRGKQFGKILMQKIENAIQNEVDSFALSAQCDKQGFYEKCGYKRLNDETYLDEGVPHCMMIKQIR